MRRPNRSERLTAKAAARPKRRASAKSHLFKYQLASNPSRAEENDLKRALQESLEDISSSNNSSRSSGGLARPTAANSKANLNLSSNSSDLSRGHNSSASNESVKSSTNLSMNSHSSRHHAAKTRSDISLATQNHNNNNTKGSSYSSATPTNVKRAKLNHHTNGHQATPTPTPQHNNNTTNISNKTNSSKCDPNLSVSFESLAIPRFAGAIKTYSRSQPKIVAQNQQQNGKHQKQPQQKLRTISPSTKTPSPQPQKHPQQQLIHIPTAPVNIQRSWSLLGLPEEKLITLREDEPQKRLICYPAIKHIEGDVIQVRDSVLLRSGARKTDLPFIAKVCAFWEDAETGGIMMSLFWYYRPEQTEEGRKPHHLPDEIFTSRHRDVDSVECIEDKCYVLTYSEYCRWKKRCKMDQVNTTWSLTDVTIPVSNEFHPRRNRLPDSDVNPELVFCCRQVYDYRLRRVLKSPKQTNPNFGLIP